MGNGAGVSERRGWVGGGIVSYRIESHENAAVGEREGGVEAEGGMEGGMGGWFLVDDASKLFAGSFVCWVVGWLGCS